jgi:long-chain acyl-CoA synthetase
MVLHPFDETGVQRDPAGIKRYVDLPDSVVAMLRTSVDRDRDTEAVVEVDGPRLTYRQL